MFYDRLERALLGEEMGRAGNDDQGLRCCQPDKSQPIELYDFMIRSADDQESRGANLVESIAGEIGATAAGNDGTDPVAQMCRRDQGCGRSGAGAEQAQLSASPDRVAVEPPDGVDEPMREREDIEDVPLIGRFIGCQQIEQERRISGCRQCFRSRDVARAEAAGAATVNEYDNGFGIAGDFAAYREARSAE